jgi:hypothetical protein
VLGATSAGVSEATISLVDLAADVTGKLPIGSVGSAGLSATLPIAITSAGAISTTSIAGFRFGNAGAADTVGTAAQAATLIQGLTGCNTATFVFTPQASDCVAPSGGGAAASTSMALGSGTGTLGHLACATSTNTMGNCTGIPSNNFMGVFLTGGTAYATTGIVSVVIDATQNVTFGDILCASSTAGLAHDNLTVSCASGESVGVVTTTASSVSTVTASLKMQ